MISYPLAFLLSAAVPLRNPRFGYQTFTFDLPPSSVSVSSEVVGGPRDAPLRPDTAAYWQPSVLPATWQLDLGALRDIDYVGIAGHTIGSNLAAVGVSLGEDNDFAARVTLPGVAGNYASTPDSVANSVTGDIDIRAKVNAADWTPTGNPYVVAKNGFTTGGGYHLRLISAGTLQLGWSTGAAALTAASTVSTGFADGSTNWIRATLDVDNGAAGYTVKFYTSFDGVTWTQLGATVTVGGVTSIGNNATLLSVGMFFDGSSDPFSGAVYYADIRNVIDGTTPVVKFDPSEGVTDGTSFTSSTGEVWTINRSGGTPARLINWRFGGADIAPVDNSPIMFLDTQRAARYLQIRLSGAGVVMPRIAVVYAGKALAMTSEVEPSGFTPMNMARQTVLKRSMSRGGQFLGQGYRRNGVAGAVAFKYLDPDWYRAYFEPFAKSARRYPYFYAWWPEHYLGEVAFVWSDKDIVGKYQGQRDWMQVGFNMQGIGND